VSDGTSLLEVMKSFQPTVLMGMTAKSGVFTEELIRTMGQQCSSPIIMPMSNPTANAECTAAQGENTA
jgi:malate dehydrogenase (oxaloacetate-decarboxylating)